MTCQAENYTISTDKTKLDLGAIYEFLSTCYWAEGIPIEVVARSINHSLCFGAYLKNEWGEDEQVGFARVVTDYATFAYIGDVFVLPPHRAHGVGTKLLNAVVGDSRLHGIRTWTLLTADAHDLYRKFDFEIPNDPTRLMRRRVANPYREREKV